MRLIKLNMEDEMKKEEILKKCNEAKVDYIRLKFSDMMGVNKNV